MNAERQTWSGRGGHPQEVSAESPFSARFEPALRGADEGSLAGLTFGAQDLFEVTGRAAGFGHPDWQATHEPAVQTSFAVQACLEAGAALVGMTISDELAFSINGTHQFFETPPNPNAPGHGPGGSSGGSSSAVALGRVDFALGPDVRAPSSYCGVPGFRSSTHLIDTHGMLPLAPSFDAVGWFAPDTQMLARVGEAMIAAPGTNLNPRRLIVARDAVAAAQPEVAAEMRRVETELRERFDAVEHVTLASEGLGSWAASFAVIQAVESWRFNGEWITEKGQRLSPDVRARFERGLTYSHDDEKKAREHMDRIDRHLADMLGDDGVLLIPTAPFPAPRVGIPDATLEPYRPKMLQLTSISGLGGIPQLCLPLMLAEGRPVGASLLSRKGSDLELLRLGERVWRT